MALVDHRLVPLPPRPVRSDCHSYASGSTTMLCLCTSSHCMPATPGPARARARPARHERCTLVPAGASRSRSRATRPPRPASVARFASGNYQHAGSPQRSAPTPGISVIPFGCRSAPNGSWVPKTLTVIHAGVNTSVARGRQRQRRATAGRSCMRPFGHRNHAAREFPISGPAVRPPRRYSPAQVHAPATRHAHADTHSAAPA